MEGVQRLHAKKPFLVIQLRPEDITADDEFAAILRHGQLTADEVVRVRVGASGLPDINTDHFAAIIVGGSPYDISTPASEKSATQNLIEAGFMALLEPVVARDVPFLGACSGNGLLGHFCGATISKRFGEPVQGIDVTITDAGRDDPLLAGMPQTIRVLVGHKEACDETPPGATLLARGAACPVQMFRLGQNVYATQFHPEGDPGGFSLRIETYRHHGYFKPDEASQLIDQLRNEATPYAHEILARFVARYRQ